MTHLSEQRSKHPLVEKYARVASKYESRWSFYVEGTTRETLSPLLIRKNSTLLSPAICFTTVVSRWLHCVKGMKKLQLSAAK